ncbi:MAG: elongation factor P hydroxylase [Legionella sp.]|uniref:elongation factor P hydroxylase n=1 Tax=Legionella sp. TaxID=459 RepID=UPI00283F427F|nr:elongation factor P hydroxylase [Legionella sp.]
MHHYEDLITIFHACFGADYNTRLVKGDNEPIYLPADEQCDFHAIFFAHGFFSSALHECSHWLIAGEERRKQVDFGYWYAPDGRTAEQQVLFQQVEVKPQAIEWILSKAAGHKFRISIDNLDGEQSDTEAFKHAVYEQVKHYCTHGLSERAKRFREAISAFYGQNAVLCANDFSLEEL